MREIPNANATPLQLWRTGSAMPAVTPTSPDDPDLDALIRAGIHYRRTPSHVTAWQEVSAAEFPCFGMAEMMLQKSDEELADAWRELPEEIQQATRAFQEIAARWLDGAEAMAAMVHRLLAARDSVEAEKEGGAA
jgi:hypothetical protein